MFRFSEICNPPLFCDVPYVLAVVLIGVAVMHRVFVGLLGDAADVLVVGALELWHRERLKPLDDDVFLWGLVGGGSLGVLDGFDISVGFLLALFSAIGVALTEVWEISVCSCFLNFEGVIGVWPLVRMGLVREFQMGEVCGSFVCEGSSEDVHGEIFLGRESLLGEDEGLGWVEILFCSARACVMVHFTSLAFFSVCIGISSSVDEFSPCCCSDVEVVPSCGSSFVDSLMVIMAVLGWSAAWLRFAVLSSVLCLVSCVGCGGMKA
ncbi:hypothetical protein Dimus_004053 [Dionaea muscipula]